MTPSVFSPARSLGLGALVLGLALSACAHGSTSVAESASPARRPAPRSRNVITQEEIAGASGTNAYDLVQQLRPSWLSRPLTGSASGLTPIMVYVDGRQAGSLDELRRVAREQIERLEWISAQDATTRYGTGNASGAIEVTTRRR